MSVLDEIELAIGREEARKLVAAFGGTTLYIPSAYRMERRPDQYRSHRLMQAVGLQAAILLSKEFGANGVRMTIPVGSASAARRQWVLYYCALKMSAREIARRLGITERAVRRIKQQLRTQGQLK